MFSVKLTHVSQLLKLCQKLFQRKIGTMLSSNRLVVPCMILRLGSVAGSVIQALGKPVFEDVFETESSWSDIQLDSCVRTTPGVNMSP